MEEHEMDRSSQRANMIEQRMFELTLTSLDTLKHSTAIEIRKAQNVMKKRLRKYRERQREIVQSKPNSNKDPIEELMRRQMKQRAKTRKERPMTSPGKLQGTRQQTDDSDESDIEIDPTFMVDHQKSKIDLRPKTAMSIVTKGRTMDKYVNEGRLGTPVKQIRYFDEDELKDRGQFYMQLVQRRITDEKDKLDNLDNKVAEFCGKETIQTMHRKMQAKQNLFKSMNTEWRGKKIVRGRSQPRSKTADRSRNRKLSSSVKTQRRGTIVGGSRKSVEIESFRKPSFLVTPV